MSILHFDPFYRATRDFNRLTGGALNAVDKGPAYDIHHGDENAFTLTLALPGYGENDVEIEVKDRTLTVRGKQPETTDSNGSYVRRQIWRGDFERVFSLAEYVEVADARLDKGLLTIQLERRLPEAMKPRTISIRTDAAPAVTAA